MDYTRTASPITKFSFMNRHLTTSHFALFFSLIAISNPGVRHGVGHLENLDLIDLRGAYSSSTLNKEALK